MDTNKFTTSKMVLDLNSDDDIISETSSKTKEADKNKVSPANFIEFIPWACHQLEVDANVIVNKDETRATLGKRSKASIQVSSRSLDKPKTSSDLGDASAVHITASYIENNLVTIKLHRCKKIPCKIFRVIGLVIKFYPFLNTIHILGGTDEYTIYELCKLLPLSNVTEIYLDNTFIKEGNHDRLLQFKQLKLLSLARCSIGDGVLSKIADRLVAEEPASLMLCALNVSSNRLTDASAWDLARVLRTNRKIKYLNLASNIITDDGMFAILKVLCEFPLTSDEALLIRQRHLLYLKRKVALTDSFYCQLKLASDFDGNNKKPKVIKHIVVPSVSAKRRGSAREDSEANAILYEKAKNMALMSVGEYADPFGTDCLTKDGVMYSNGNNILAYLNVSYNDLGYSSVKKILKVLRHQRALARRPLGLLNLVIDGNPIPDACTELIEIDQLVELTLMGLQRARGSKIRVTKK